VAALGLDHAGRVEVVEAAPAQGGGHGVGHRRRQRVAAGDARPLAEPDGDATRAPLLDGDARAAHVQVVMPLVGVTDAFGNLELSEAAWQGRRLGHDSDAEV
jgi:hypothetical protein